VLWAGYGFSVGHVRESMQLTPRTCHHSNTSQGPWRSIARDAVISDWALPARLLKGIATAWTLNKSTPLGLYVGENQSGRMVVLLSRRNRRKNTLAVSDPVHDRDGCFVRTPGREGAGKRWPRPYLPIALLAVTMGVSYDAGLRHVLLCFRC